MLPAPTTEPFRSITFDQCNTLEEHLTDARHATILIAEVLNAQLSGRTDDSSAEISIQILSALVDRADAATQHLAAIEILFNTVTAS